MATRNIVPRGNGEGSLGTSAKKWDAAFINKLNNADVNDLTGWSSEAFRRPETHYDAGELKMHPSLPTGCCLECITAGTTSSGDLAISTVTPDVTTLTDGTVTWIVRRKVTTAMLGYRQPSTAYSVGVIKFNPDLPTGCYLECTTAGTTGSGALSTGGGISVYDTITDGTVTWTVLNFHVGTFNKKQTFTSSGTFTAPVTGTYKITLQGAGGGGGGYGKFTTGYYGGGGGGQGAKLEFYEKLTAGTSYSYTIGAGGNGGTSSATQGSSTSGTTGGDSSITINGNSYLCKGGMAGSAAASGATGGRGGLAKINDVTVGRGASGGVGQTFSSTGIIISGGVGGGTGGSNVYDQTGLYGGGGVGGVALVDGTVQNGSAGGDGYITFEYYTQLS